MEKTEFLFFVLERFSSLIFSGCCLHLFSFHVSSFPFSSSFYQNLCSRALLQSSLRPPDDVNAYLHKHPPRTCIDIWRCTRALLTLVDQLVMKRNEETGHAFFFLVFLFFFAMLMSVMKAWNSLSHSRDLTQHKRAIQLGGSNQTGGIARL